MKDASELRWHSSTLITSDIYTHLFEPARREVAEGPTKPTPSA
jgi:hypothetical protein